MYAGPDKCELTKKVLEHTNEQNRAEPFIWEIGSRRKVVARCCFVQSAHVENLVDSKNTLKGSYKMLWIIAKVSDVITHRYNHRHRAFSNSPRNVFVGFSLYKIPWYYRQSGQAPSDSRWWCNAPYCSKDGDIIISHKYKLSDSWTAFNRVLSYQ